MDRYEAYEQLRGTVARQLAEARAARERAELQAVVAKLIVLTLATAAALVSLLFLT